MAVQMQPKTKGVLTVVVQGTGADLNHAAAREAEKMYDNGLIVTRSSDVYFDKGGNPAMDLEWKVNPDWDTPEHPARTFQGHIARSSTEHPEGEGKELVNEHPADVLEIKKASTREPAATAGKKAGSRAAKPVVKKAKRKN